MEAQQQQQQQQQVVYCVLLILPCLGAYCPQKNTINLQE
jgi:hypothetical protein